MGTLTEQTPVPIARRQFVTTQRKDNTSDQRVPKFSETQPTTKKQHFRYCDSQSISSLGDEVMAGVIISQQLDNKKPPRPKPILDKSGTYNPVMTYDSNKSE